MYLRAQAPWLLAVSLFGSFNLLGQQSGGLTAHTRPDDYAVHITTGDYTLAATLLTSEQVKHTFASDISKKYAVFEVACYPESGATVDLRSDAFITDGRDKDIVRSADAMTVAARMEQKKSPPQLPSQMGNVQTEANVGYGTGTDPYTGRRVHETYENVGVGVNNYPDRGSRTPDPPDWAHDMETLQRQLEDRALPSGKFSHPVAGYLYFPVALLKKPGKDGYHLKYEAGISDTAALTVPLKSR